MHADHPIFTRVYSALSGLGERTGLGDIRERVMTGVHGRLLIVGMGPGHDLDHVPSAVTSVVAIEPSQSMRRAAQPRVRRLFDRGVDIDVMDARAERLPLPDASVDCALVAYVLCTVTDQDAALAEIHRVLKPGGILCVLEHVAARPGTPTEIIQRLVTPIWPRLAGGCRVDRDTLSSIREAGFDVADLTLIRLASLPPVSLTLVGRARRPE